MKKLQSANLVTADFAEVLSRFCVEYPNCTITPIGHGNINDTYLVRSSTGRFILQKLSTFVFPKPHRVIDNFCRLVEHLEQKTGEIAPGWQFARPVNTSSGDLFYQDLKGEFWRGQTYLPHRTVSALSGSEQAQQLGQTLGLFHLLVSDLARENLYDPLPDFHILPTYLEQYDLAWRNRSDKRGEDVYCFEIIEKYRLRTVMLEEAKEEGILTVQAIHGDPKIDNFIFDKEGCGVGLIDMDTVGFGLLHYDLGDCLRSSCNRSGENPSVEGDVRFDMEICRAILHGYFRRAATLLSSWDRHYIFDAVLLITFELGLRFFTDYLRGNIYFKVEKSDENLQKAVIQFRLVEEIEKCEQEIRLLSKGLQG